MACPWLIKKFVDKDAKFLFVSTDQVTAVASITSLARSMGSSTSPVFAGLLLQGSLLLVGWPFILAGTLKVAYDLTLWSIFRRISLPEEQHTAPDGEGSKP